jgi:hypothetical protein
VSFHKEPFRILAGSLNLLPPADKAAEGDSLALTNWRVDQAGQLRSRRGMVHATGDIAGSNGHTLFRQSPNRRFLGIDGLLYRSEGPNNYNQIASGFDGQPLGMETQAGFTWIMNQAQQGKDDGVGGAMKAWLPAAPTSAPTATAGGQISKTVGAFASTEPWTVIQPDGNTSGVVTTVYSTAGTVAIAHSTDVEGTGTAFDPTFVGDRFQVSGDPVSYGIVAVISPTELTLDAPYVGMVSGVGFTIFKVDSVFDFNSTAVINGHSLHIACNPAGSWVANLTVSEDLSINTQQRDEDKFRIWVYCSDPTAISQVTLQIDVNTGNYDLDTYQVTIPGSALNQGGFSWTQVAIRRALDTAAVLAANPDFASLQALVDAGILDSLLAFDRTGSTAGKDWTTVKTLRVTVDVTDDVDVNLAAWDVIGGATAPLEGDYTWFVTYTTAAGHETNGSPAMAAALTLDMQAATLSNVPVSADPQVTARNIYRDGGALAGPLKVGSIPDNVTTTFLDQVTDANAQAEDTPLPIDHDPPPAAFGVIRHLGKLIAFNSLKHPGRFWWTKTAQPWYFPGADDEDVGQWQDTGEDNEAILGARSHNRTLIFYKERSIVRLYGDPDTSDPEQTSSTIGLIGPRAHDEAGPLDYITGAEGIYSFNAETETKVSGKIDPIFKGDYAILSTTAGVANIVVAPLNPDQKRNSVLAHINGRLYFSYPSLAIGGAQPDITLVCDLATGRWYQHLLDDDLNGAGGFTALYYEGQDRGLIGALSTASGIVVYQLELNTTDDGNAIPLAWHSGYADQNLPQNPKVYGDLVVVHKTGDQNGTSPLTVSLYFDNGASNQAIGTINSAARTVSVFPLGSAGLGMSAKNFALRIEGDATTECIIFDAFVYWYVEARDGMVFDSGVIDLGSDKVKQVDQMELEVTGSANGTLTWYWRGDLPGGTIAQRQTGTIPLSGARANVRPPIAGYVEGRKLRVICTADVPFQLHALRARVLEIAEYIDGTAGEKWTSREISYG